jgi:single-strand DNA-binding protein
MNKIFLIGNLTRDPELRATSSGIPVCTFSIAVKRKQKPEAGQPEADFFRVTTWRQLAENCNRFLRKGKKAGVVGSLSLNIFKGKDGADKPSLEVQADEVEFLSPKDEPCEESTPSVPAGFVAVNDDDLPF